MSVHPFVQVDDGRFSTILWGSALEIAADGTFPTMKIDHHIHTSKHSPDSVLDPLELIASAKQAKLDGVVITEHDYQWESEELAELSARADGLLVLSGVEVSTRQGHFLVYGLPNLEEFEPGLSVSELLKVVKRRDAAIVAAHPFRWGQDFRAILHEVGPVFDALELVSNNVEPDVRLEIEQTAKAYPSMGLTGSSDSHEARFVGCYYSVFPGPIRSMPEFVAALKARAGRPGSCEDRPLISGPVPRRPRQRRDEIVI